VATGSFLSLLKQGAYAGTFFHNLETGMRLRGGLDRFTNADGLSQRSGLVDVDDASGHANTEMTLSLPVDNSGPTPRWPGEMVFNLADNWAATSFIAIGRVIQGWSVIMDVAGLGTLDLSGFFPGNPVGAGLTSVPVTRTDPPPTQVTEDLLVSTS